MSLLRCTAAFPFIQRSQDLLFSHVDTLHGTPNPRHGIFYFGKHLWRSSRSSSKLDQDLQGLVTPKAFISEGI